MPSPETISYDTSQFVRTMDGKTLRRVAEGGHVDVVQLRGPGISISRYNGGKDPIFDVYLDPRAIEENHPFTIDAMHPPFNKDGVELNVPAPVRLNVHMKHIREALEYRPNGRR